LIVCATLTFYIIACLVYSTSTRWSEAGRAQVWTLAFLALSSLALGCSVFACFLVDADGYVGLARNEEPNRRKRHPRGNDFGKYPKEKESPVRDDSRNPMSPPPTPEDKREEGYRSRFWRRDRVAASPAAPLGEVTAVTLAPDPAEEEEVDGGSAQLPEMGPLLSQLGYAEATVSSNDW